MKKLIFFSLALAPLILPAQPTPWIPVGPAPQDSRFYGPVSGRVIAIGVADSYTESGITRPAAMFIAPEGGGLWRSENFEGIIPTWIPVLDEFLPESKNIFSIAASGINPKEIYAGGTNGNLFHSSDGGFHWEKIITGASTNDAGSIVKVILHPFTDQVYFATRFTNNTANNYIMGGVYRQVGTTHTFAQVNMGLTDEGLFITDMDYTVDNQNNISLYLGAAPANNTTSGAARGVWRFKETTTAWEHLTINLTKDLASGFTMAAELMGTVLIACDHHPGAALGIYAAVVNSVSNTILNVYKFANNTWTPVGTPIKDLGTTFSTYACIVMCLSPSGELYIGCGNVPEHSVFQSTDGGGHWSSVREGTNGLTPHNDERSMAFYDGNLYLGNDGGINRFFPLPNFVPGRSEWSSLSTKGLQTNLVNGVGMNPTNPNIILCGNQDNALALLNNGFWVEHTGTDNSKVLFDPNPADGGKTAYTSGTDSYDFFIRSDDGGITWNKKSPEDMNDAEGHQAAGSDWYTPFAFHPDNSARIVVGIDRIYETFDKGDNWGKQKSPIFNPAGKRKDGRPFGHGSTAISYGYGDRIWVAYEGKIFITENDGGDGSMSNWTDVTRAKGFPGKIIQICVDPRNHDNVYLGVVNGSIWKSQRTGNSWDWSNITTLDAGLLNKLTLVTPMYLGLPVLFAGTDEGLFFTSDEGATWWLLNNGLPRTTVMDIQYAPFIQTMVCGLWGRGVYKNPIGSLLTKDGQPSLSINFPKDNCGIPPIEGATVALWFTLKNPVDNDPFTIKWTITGANNVAGETFTNAKCNIEIPIPAPTITAKVEITYKGGPTISSTKVIPTVTQQVAAGMTFFCKYKERLKPIPWWEWDPDKWRLDPKTNKMVLQLFNRKELLQVVRNLQVNLQNLQKTLKTNGQ